MSVDRPNIVTPEEFQENKAKIETYKAFLVEYESMNESGRRNWEIERAKSELQRRVQEGEEARRVLQELERASNPTPVGSAVPGLGIGQPMSRIEEVPSPNQALNVRVTQPLNYGVTSYQDPHQQRSVPFQSFPPTAAHNYPGNVHFNNEQQLQYASLPGPVANSQPALNHGQNSSTNASLGPTSRTFANYYPAEQTVQQRNLAEQLQGSQRSHLPSQQPLHSGQSHPLQGQPAQSFQAGPSQHLHVAQAVPNQQQASLQQRLVSSSFSNQNQFPPSHQTQAPPSAPRPSSSIIQVPANTGNLNQQPSHKSLHAKPSEIPNSSTSSLVGALGGKPSAAPTRPQHKLDSSGPSTSSASSSIPIPPTRSVNKAPLQKPQPEAGSSSNFLQLVVPQSTVALSKSIILGHRQAALAWASAAPLNAIVEVPGTSTQVTLYKDVEGVTHVYALVNGQKVREPMNRFFNNELAQAEAGIPSPFFPLRLNNMTTAPPTSNATPPTTKTPPFSSKDSIRPTAVGSTVVKHTIIIPAARSRMGASAIGLKDTPSAAKAGVTTTPLRKQLSIVDINGTPRSSADADKKRLAKDLMFALGKRKHEDILSTTPVGHAAKKQAVASEITGKPEAANLLKAVPTTSVSTLVAPMTATNPIMALSIPPISSQPITEPIPKPDITPTPATTHTSTSPSTQAAQSSESQASSSVNGGLISSSVSLASNSSALPTPNPYHALLSGPAPYGPTGKIRWKASGKTTGTFPYNDPASFAACGPDQKHVFIEYEPQASSSMPNVVTVTKPSFVSSSSVQKGIPQTNAGSNDLESSSAATGPATVPSPAVVSSTSEPKIPVAIQTNGASDNATSLTLTSNNTAPLQSATSSSTTSPSLQKASSQANNISKNVVPLLVSNPNSGVESPPTKPSSTKTQHDATTSSKADISSNKTTLDTSGGANMPIDLTSPGPSRRPLPAEDQEPLFLPSPSSSLAPDQEKTRIQGMVRDKKRRKLKYEVYVDVPPPPKYLVQYREQQKRKVARATGVTVPSGSGSESSSVPTHRKEPGDRTRSASVSMSVPSGELEDLSFALESQLDDLGDEDEREAIQLVGSRLQELPCRWDGCDVVLNSIESLIRHLNRHKPPSNERATQYFTCRWTQCGRRINIREKHLEKHASQTLPCAYKDCEKSFRSGSQLLKHFRAQHSRGVLKPTAQLALPKLEILEPVPSVILPSYAIVSGIVKPTRINHDRHMLLGPWVLRNIAGTDQEKPARQRSKKTARSVPAEACNTYEYLTKRSTRYSSYQSQPVDMNIEDLDSAAISKEVAKGLTLWGEGNEEEDDGTGGMNTPEPLSPFLLPVEGDGGDVNLEKAGGSGASRDRGGHGYHQQEHSDEDAIQMMLTEL